jgi:hypothetical protein
MDEKTRQRLENKQLKEHETDAEMQYLQFYKESEMKLTFREIIEFAWDCGTRGIARSITKRKFIDEFCEHRINNYNFELEQNCEAEKYNY